MISVIIPIYNVEKYLAECIESVINQTFSDLEIILVNDGSTDNCREICENYKRKDSRIKLIHKINGGISSARNAGIDIANGDYYTFIDSDDYIMPDMIEQLFYISKSTDADISICCIANNKDEFDKGINKDIEILTKEETLKCILTEKKILTSACGKLYKSELFNVVRYPDGKIYEDLGTTYKLVELSEKIAFVNVKKYYYRTNNESITKSSFSNRQMEYYIIAEELQKFVKQKYPQYFKYAIYHSVRISISFMRKISECEFEDKETINFLISNIRTNILKYLFSEYSIFSKLYGVLICISPATALSLFRNKNKKIKECNDENK